MMDLKIVEDKLNKLCSEHDELMSLLQIFDYIPNLKNMVQMNRGISSRLQAHQQFLKELFLEKETLKQEQSIVKVNKFQSFKKNLGKIQERLKEYEKAVDSFDDKIQNYNSEVENLAFHQAISKMRTDINRIVEQQSKIITRQIAEFKNNLQNKQVTTQSIKSSKDLKINKERIKLILKKVLKPQIQAYDRLAHQIEHQRLKFTSPPLLPFIDYISQQLKQTLQKQMQRFQQYFTQNQNPRSYLYLERVKQCISYRIKSLKRFVLRELLQLYQKEDHLKVNTLQKLINSKLRELQSVYQLFEDSIRTYEIWQN